MSKQEKSNKRPAKSEYALRTDRLREQAVTEPSGGSSALENEQEVADLRDTSRYGGRDSGLGIHGTHRGEAKKEEPPRPRDYAPDRDAAPGDVPPEETDKVDGPETKYAAESTGDLNRHAGHGGGALGRPGAGLASGGSSDPLLGEGTTGNNAGNG